MCGIHLCFYLNLNWPRKIYIQQKSQNINEFTNFIHAYIQMHYYNNKYDDKCMFGTTEGALYARKCHVRPHVIVNGSYSYYHPHT